MGKIPLLIEDPSPKQNLAAEILNFIPASFDRLVEPFAGFADMTITCASQKKVNSFLINGLNKSLIELLRLTIEQPDALIGKYKEIWTEKKKNSAEYFNKIREQFNNENDPAFYLFLLERCEKGAMRYNPEGLFGSNPDKKSKAIDPSLMKKNVSDISALLKGKVSFSTLDYKEVLAQAIPGDIVYMEPPCPGLCGKKDTKYFSGIVQEEFAEELKKLVDKKISFIVTYDVKCGNKQNRKEIAIEKGVKHLTLKTSDPSQPLVESVYISDDLYFKNDSTVKPDVRKKKLKIDFSKLQEIEKAHLEKDRAMQTIETNGAELDEALADAAILLDVPVTHIDYEVLQTGFSGLMGVGKKDWRIRASLKPGVVRKKAAEQEEEKVEAAPVVVYKDGEAFVQRDLNGKVLLKVTAPSGGGQKVAEVSVRQLLIDKKATDIERQIVMNVIREASGEYIPVANYEHHSYNDSVVKTEISEDEMTAYMEVTEPGDGGADMSYEAYIATFKINKIVGGVKEDYLKEFVDKPVYNEKVEIAVGPKAINGRDAYIQYFFETDQSKMNFKEGAGGNIDFKELNIIQNVTAGQEVAKKILAEKGVYGKTVTGRLLDKTDGKDIELPLGLNTKAADDGITILATIDGQVIKTLTSINVEPVLTIAGDVNLKTGNIDFKGTVVVKGNVEDGFTVKAAGNIEVNGNVGKANLDSEGDVVIHQGVNGKGGGFIKAGKSLWAKFIENANIETGNLVIVSDGIINSQVSANSKILVQGKRASIMGGRLRASEEINAKVLGNAMTGTATIFEVGYDPKKKAEQEKLEETKTGLEKQFDSIKNSIKTLQNAKKQRGSLPAEKESQLIELIQAQSNTELELEKTKGDIAKIQEYLDTLKGKGKISASDAVHAGVKIAIRDQVNDIKSTQKSVTFAVDGSGLIKAGKYEAPIEMQTGELEGFSTPGPSASGSPAGYKKMEHSFGDTADRIGSRARGDGGTEKKEKKGLFDGLFKKKEKPEEAAEAAPEAKDGVNVLKLIDEKRLKKKK